MYSGAEFGHLFDLKNGFNLSPFVGIGGKYLSVANQDDTTVFLSGGADLGYVYEINGLRYDYTVRALVQTDNTMGVGINASVWSVFDEAGADLQIGAIYDDYFWLSYRTSLNGHFRF